MFRIASSSSFSRALLGHVHMQGKHRYLAKGEAPLIRCFSSSYELSSFATLDPKKKTLSIGEDSLYKAENLVGGKWQPVKKYDTIIDPLTGEDMLSIPNTGLEEINPFITSLGSCPKTGLHNPFKNIERYRLYGDVCF